MDLLNIPEKKKMQPKIPDFNSLTKEEQENYLYDLLYKTTVEKKSLKEILAIDPLLLDHLYLCGSDHYTAGSYAKAYEIFHFLVTVDTRNFNYLYALASTSHQMKNYTNAIFMYTALLDFPEANAEVAYYLADCFYHENLFEEAKAGYTLTIEWCENTKEHRLLKEQCLMLIESLNI